MKTEYPRIAREAKRYGAHIAFGDEAPVRSDYHSKPTWAPLGQKTLGQTPVVERTGARF